MPSTQNRIAITLTPVTRKRLDATCEKLRNVEGAKVVPTRIINDLIMTHLEPHPDEGMQISQANARPKRKGVSLARSA